MKPIHYVLLTIAAIIVIAAVSLNWSKIKDFFAGNYDGKACKTSDGKDGTYKDGVCTASAPAEGSACMIGSDAGTIVNGVCVKNQAAQRRATQIQITNPNGANTLAYQNGGFVTPNTSVLIPVGTILPIIGYVPSPKVYYNTPQGWIDGNDAKLYA